MWRLCRLRAPLLQCTLQVLVCALCHQACSIGLFTIFLSTNHFADEQTKARLEGTYQKFIKILGKKVLLILDDFGLQPLPQEVRLVLLTLLEDRYEEKSVVITSQLSLAQIGH